MRSSWDETRAKSAYHFDPALKDPRWDTVTGLGHITPCWTEELKEIIATATPATWANRGYKGQGVEVPNLTWPQKNMIYSVWARTLT